MNPAVPTAIDSIAVEIGGIPIVFSSDDLRFHSMVEQHYGEFARAADSLDATSAPLCFAVQLQEQGSLSDGEDVQVWKSGDIWYASRGDFRADLNIRDRQGHIRLQLNPYGLNSIVRIM